MVVNSGSGRPFEDELVLLAVWRRGGFDDVQVSEINDINV